MSGAPSRLIRGESWVADDWILADPEQPVPAAAKLIIDYEPFIQERDRFASAGQLGVLLPNTLNVVDAWPELAALPLIALCFPKFGDGRAYSQASLLRERCGFKGELRALGEVLVDQLCDLRRCGFDALVPRQDQDPQACLRALQGFSFVYQSAADGRPNAWQLRRKAATHSA